MQEEYHLTHSCIINDPYVVDFFRKILVKGEKSVLSEKDIERVDE
jgi:hypothetical protein